MLVISSSKTGRMAKRTGRTPNSSVNRTQIPLRGLRAGYLKR